MFYFAANTSPLRSSRSLRFWILGQRLPIGRHERGQVPQSRGREHAIAVEIAEQRAHKPDPCLVAAHHNPAPGGHKREGWIAKREAATPRPLLRHDDGERVMLQAARVAGQIGGERGLNGVPGSFVIVDHCMEIIL